jgi:hypothetical protein
MSVAASATASRLSAVADSLCRAFLRDGVWESMRHHLVVMLRERDGRKTSPTAVIIDTQSVKTTEKGGHAAMMPQSG